MRPKNSILKETRDAAAVGIGTMIVFIATVLVAAIAAGVLIDMSGKLQSRSQATGQEATEQVSSNLVFDRVIGARNGTGPSTLGYMHIFASLAAGASEVDLDETLLQITTGTDIKTLVYNSAANTGGLYSASEERDSDSSWSAAAPVMTSGDLVRINASLDHNNMELSPRTQVALTLIPETGAAATVQFTTPNSYGTNTKVTLA